MSAITAKASRKMKKYAVLTREPRCFLGSFDFSWEQRKLEDYLTVSAEKNTGNIYGRSDVLSVSGDYGIVNQIEFQGRSFAGASVSNYGVVQTGDVVYTKSPLNSNPYGIIKTNKGKPGIVSTLYAVYHPKENAFSDFIQVYFEQHARMNNYMHPLVNKGAKNDMKVSAENALKGPVCFPSRIEQESISAFFSVLDNLITLHQRKCVFLFGFFQAFISMIFTASTFSWEQRKVQDVADRFDNLRIPVAANLRVHGTTPYYGANGIQDYVEGFTHDGEFVLVAEDGANDLKNYPVKCVNGRIWVNNHAHVLQGKAGIADNSFLAFAISQSDIESLLVGGGRAKLNAETLMSIEFRLPCLQEQYRIGEYLTQLDHLITLHQRKFEKLTNVKKSMLEKMFPQNGSSYPEIRFKGFTDPWEQRKVGDLLIERNQQAPMSDEYPLMAFIANEGVAPKGERYDRSALVTDTVNKLYKKTEKGDFIYSSNNLETGSIGLNKYGKACISPVYSIFEPTGIADSDFLGRRLVRKDFINAMVKWRQGVIYGQWRIHESDFLKIEITVPSVEEQRKIGAYLDQLDHLITLHQRKGKQPSPAAPMMQIIQKVFIVKHGISDINVKKSQISTDSMLNCSVHLLRIG